VSAADCPGCGLPVATPADAGSWTPDGTVCWRGGRCEVSAADDADRALDRLLMARGAGETRPVGSASIDRLRQIAAAWHRAVHVDSSMLPVHICDLDAVLADAIAERTRAAAAEAECARLRAIIEGRATAPTEAELVAHIAAGGRWLVSSPGEPDVPLWSMPVASVEHGLRVAQDHHDLNAPWRWHALLDGRPCPWPTPALDATGEGR